MISSSRRRISAARSAVSASRPWAALSSTSAPTSRAESIVAPVVPPRLAILAGEVEGNAAQGSDETEGEDAVTIPGSGNSADSASESTEEASAACEDVSAEDAALPSGAGEISPPPANEDNEE